MPGETLVTITYESASGFAEDRVVNTFAVDNFGSTANATAANVVAHFDNWLSAQDSGTNRLAGYLSPSLSRSVNPIIRLYNIAPFLDGSAHGSPFHEAQLTDLSAANGGPLPGEVALCVTHRAVAWEIQPIEESDGADTGIAPDRPRQRYTGRVYLGPLTVSAGTGTGDSVPSTPFLTCVGEAYTRLATNLRDDDMRLSVWSRKDEALREVDVIQIDNAWDTQRRRGRAATTRTTVNI